MCRCWTCAASFPPSSTTFFTALTPVTPSTIDLGLPCLLLPITSLFRRLIVVLSSSPPPPLSSCIDFFRLFIDFGRLFIDFFRLFIGFGRLFIDVARLCIDFVILSLYHYPF